MKHESRKERVDQVKRLLKLGKSEVEIAKIMCVTLRQVKIYMEEPMRQCERCTKFSTAVYRFKGESICGECLNGDMEPIKPAPTGFSSLVNAAYP